MQEFQALTLRFNRRTNVLLSTVGLSQAFDPQVTKTNRPPQVDVNAIWDTGASCTVITKTVATKIGLISTGKTTVNGVNSEAEANTYFVNVYLPNGVCIFNLKIVEAETIAGADMLLGMDILGMGDLSVYNENGKTVMSYRIPSIGGTDFVVEHGNMTAQRAITQKIEAQKNARKPLNSKMKKKKKTERSNKKKGRKK
ncbi:MAG: retroviral-like aspartic protease family protein [Candidatus Levyibacteriota bacterium]